MTIMSAVTPVNASRVASNFKPFHPLPLDLYLSIRTFDQNEPIVHCVYTRHERLYNGTKFFPGLYIYSHDRRADVELLWYYGEADVDELDGILTDINCKDVFDHDAMNALGFISASPGISFTSQPA